FVTPNRAASVVIQLLLGVTWMVPTAGINSPLPVLLLFATLSKSHSNPRTRLLTCQLNPSWPPPMNAPLLLPLLRFRPNRVSVTVLRAQEAHKAAPHQRHSRSASRADRYRPRAAAPA